MLSPINESRHRNPISIGQRLIGIGTAFIGFFALSYSLAFVQSLWNTPSRNLGVGVTIGSLLMIFVGLVIGVPDLLPRKIVAVGLILFGFCSVLFGVAVLLWVAYNIFIERQAEFLMGSLIMPCMMIAVGLGIIAKGWRQWNHRA